MNIKIDVDINTARIMRERGLGGDNRARVFLASEVKRFCDPYVPMQQGTLKNTAVVASDGSSLTYIQPYAHYQYKAQVMGPNYQDANGDWHSGKAPKHYTGRALTYSGGGVRGAEWDKRMMADKSRELTQSLANFVGGRAE